MLSHRRGSALGVLAALGLLVGACTPTKKAGMPPLGQVLAPAAVTEHLAGTGTHQWALQGRTQNGKKMPIDACEKQDRIVFLPDGKLKLEDYQMGDDQKCQQTMMEGQWQFDAQSQQLTISLQTSGQDPVDLKLDMQGLNADYLVIAEGTGADQIVSIFRRVK